MADVEERRIQGYGWKPDLPDHRDLIAPAEFERGAAKKYPKIFGLRDRAEKVGKPWDQSQLGSCTGHGCGFLVSMARQMQGLSNLMPSRLFIYYGERVIEGSVDQDAGAMIRDGMKVISKWGAPSEDLWPYDIEKFAQKPPQEAFDAGVLDQSVRYSRVTRSLSAMKAAIFAGHPIVFGFSVFEKFESDEVARTGIVPMPTHNESMLGGHCTALIGWDDGRQLFEVRNSWGPDWGDHGYFWMPYAYVLDANLADDFWILQLMETTTKLI